MIVLDPKPTFRAEVTLTRPGSNEETTAWFTFRSFNRKRTIALLVLVRAIPRIIFRRWFGYWQLCWRVKRIATMVDLLDELIVEWDADDIDLPYSKAALRSLLEESPGAATNILFAWMNNHEEARRKN